jgi:hypothetical protein
MRIRNRTRHPAWMARDVDGVTTHNCLHCGYPMTYKLVTAPRKYHDACAATADRIQSTTNRRAKRLKAQKRKKTMKLPRYLEVKVEVPADVPIQEAKDYIRSELKAAGGQRRPEDPLFQGLEVKTIRSVRS